MILDQISEQKLQTFLTKLKKKHRIVKIFMESEWTYKTPYQDRVDLTRTNRFQKAKRMWRR